MKEEKCTTKEPSRNTDNSKKAYETERNELEDFTTMTRMTKIVKKSISPRRCNLSSSPSLFFQLVLGLSMILGTTIHKNSVDGFSLTSLTAPSHPTSSMMSSSSSSPFQSRLGARGSDIDDDEREREFARVRRRKGRGGYADDEDDGYETDGRNADSVMDAANMLEDEGFFDEMDDEDYDEDDEDDREDDESYDMFSNTVIPNPLLDSIDPDGAAERFPELAADPRFWLDMFLFIAFLNFISFIGPRNPFPEMIPAMYTAGLPPPGM